MKPPAPKPAPVPPMSAHKPCKGCAAVRRIFTAIFRQPSGK